MSARPPSLRAVLFDWDGTLVNSAETSYRAYQGLFKALGIPFDREVYARTYSPNWHRTYEALALPREQWDDADALWLRFYAEERNELLPGVSEALHRLQGAGHAQGIVSSGERERVTQEMRELEVARYFTEVVCGGDTAQRKPHPEPLLVALERMGLRPEEAAYVGDSPEDMEMARGAEVFAIGIPGAFPNREALVASRPDFLAESLERAVALLLD
ncbi:MAG TPA: HAD family hydrolase [Vicinamibacteria bacterium]